jgi:glycosyltransferase involved in cell wall biosynthesis
MSKVLIVTKYFYPSYKAGGPVRSLVNLIEVLSKDNDLYVISGDRDLGDSTSFKSVKINDWNKIDETPVFYLSLSVQNIYTLAKNIKKHQFDFVYLNGFFEMKYSFVFYLLTKLKFISSKKIMIAPRGELSNGAMSLKKLKKEIFIRFFKLIDFSNKSEIQYTSLIEAEESNKRLSGYKYRIVPNMHESIPNFFPNEKRTGSLDICFISRISPKKNLNYILDVLSGINKGNITFNIAGGIDDDLYWEECKKIISSLPLNINVKYLGALNRKEVVSLFQKSHLFVLATLNENYGHSIVEAMVNTNLVLISDQTPWSDISNHGGYAVKLNEKTKYKEIINKLVDMNDLEYKLECKKIYDFAIESLAKNESKVLGIFGE